MSHPWNDFLKNRVPGIGGAWSTGFESRPQGRWHQRRLKDQQTKDDYTGFRVFMAPIESAQNN